MKIDKVVGTGGIGTGMFFCLEGQHTFGRDESRLAYLSDDKDYCKQHIILHYIATLNKKVKVYAIGKLGNDEQGHTLISEMHSAVINTDFVSVTDEARTMFSISFQYPDNSGGNITTSNSACRLVTPEYIEECSGCIDDKTLILAAPEVPLESRIKLLEIGRKNGAFSAVSILSGEVEQFEKRNNYALCDLFAVNIDEAKAISGKSGPVEEIVYAAVDKIKACNPKIKLIITCGKYGCYTYECNNIEKLQIIDVPVVNTAGAGDTLLGGTIVGLINDMPFQKGCDDKFFAETPLKSAVEFGTLVSTLKVMSHDTIVKSISSEKIAEFINERAYRQSGVFANGI
jgi:sugar/nucleoside kinase (ribokinase family)